MRKIFILLSLVFATYASTQAKQKVQEVESLESLMQAVAKDGQNIKMKPGTYAIDEYLTEERLKALLAELPPQTESMKRPPRWFLRFGGDNNTIDLTGVTFEINTALYKKLPYGYMRCVFIDGNGNTIKGLTIKNTGDKSIGSNGNILTVFGDNTTLEDVKLYVNGSSYGYGDLFGKGGPNLTGMSKQSGIMVAGQNNTLKGCKVFSRAFGHCFYIQTQGHDTKDIVLENCYAEGEMRTTNDILAERGGLAEELQYRSVYENREGRFMINPGYTKSLVEDGFRTYGGVGKVTLINCSAKNTRSGFEIGGTNDAETRTTLQGCQALGTERGFLLGSNVLVRDCRADMQYGPLLYLREGTVGADVELELIPTMPKSLVHMIATIAGKNHKVHLYTNDADAASLTLPIMLGFAMPAHAEMSSKILPAETANVELVNDVDQSFVVVSDEVKDMKVESVAPHVLDSESKKLRGRGKW